MESSDLEIEIGTSKYGAFVRENWDTIDSMIGLIQHKGRNAEETGRPLLPSPHIEKIKS